MAIITISRQMGTGAYQIATDVAKRLKYSLVDGSRIVELAAAYGLSEEELQWVDEKPPIAITDDDQRYAALLSALELVLLECCRHGNVIIYGRGGQDLLAGMNNVLRLRFVAPFDVRVENFAEREWLDPDLARTLIRKSDQQRNGFISYYFERDWNDSLGYDLVFNTSRLSPSAVVESIIAAVRDPCLTKGEAESFRLLEEKILCKRIETELLKSGAVEYLHFRTDVEKGVVTFSGHVHNDAERQSAIAIAKGIAGAVRVIDHLHVVEYRRYRGEQ
jgi:cytidylate kinase